MVKLKLRPCTVSEVTAIGCGLWSIEYMTAFHPPVSAFEIFSRVRRPLPWPVCSVPCQLPEISCARSAPHIRISIATPATHVVNRNIRIWILRCAAWVRGARQFKFRQFYQPALRTGLLSTPPHRLSFRSAAKESAFALPPRLLSTPQIRPFLHSRPLTPFV